MAGLDYAPAIAIIAARGWDVVLALELLQAIELALIDARKEKADE